MSRLPPGPPGPHNEKGCPARVTAVVALSSRGWSPPWLRAQPPQQPLLGREGRSQVSLVFAAPFLDLWLQRFFGGGGEGGAGGMGGGLSFLEFSRLLFLQCPV